MPLTVNTNVASLAAQRSMLSTNSALETSFERLSTGKRINSAADDAAGLAVSQSLTSSINGMNQAIRNTNDGISAAQIAEGALAEVTDILQRMRDLAVQANTGFLSSTEKGFLQSEQVKLETALDNVVGAAKFSDTALFGATAESTGFTFQTGAARGDTSSFTTKVISSTDIAYEKTAGVQATINLSLIDLTEANSGSAHVAPDGTDDTSSGVDDTYARGTGPNGAIADIDLAIDAISSLRADLGAAMSEFESTVRNLANVTQNTEAARSRIMDTDYAAETANLTKNQILQQASTSILAQANQQPQSVLALLQ
ncbi:flagellin/flagellar hook associated protein [gamma proteobacterium HIMB55]|nr:flagellin/flagellar hook associated protein [gamma proteobacterium HIMB55]